MFKAGVGVQERACVRDGVGHFWDLVAGSVVSNSVSNSLSDSV